MKKYRFNLLLAGLLWLPALAASAQNFSSENLFLLDVVATCKKNYGDGEYSDWESLDPYVAAVFDKKRERIDFHNTAGNRFRLLQFTDEGINSSGDQYSIYEAIDEEGIYCTVSLIFEETRGQTYLHLYAQYSNLSMGFLMVAAD